MREDRRFAERTRVLNSDEALKKFFLVYEGTETEAIYFDEMLLCRENIGISPLIELIPLVRSFSEEGFFLCVTNPCFEFWLLLHFDGVFDLDKAKLLENPKVTSKRRYAEDELRKISPGYRKNRYDAKKFMKRINKAIENEKSFCEDLEGLEYSVGSAIWES